MRFTSKTLVVAGLLATGAAVVAAAVADPATELAGVPAANTKSAGYAPASMLSPELGQIVVAQGSTRSRTRRAADLLLRLRQRRPRARRASRMMVPTPATPTTEAQKTEPDKNTYLVFKKGLQGADPSYDYGTHFLFQGHEGGSPRLHHADQPRRRRGAPRDAARDAGRRRQRRSPTIDGSTWDPWAKRLLFTTENPNAPTVLGDARLPVDGRRRLRRARPRRLRGHPGRLGRQHLDRRGHRRRRTRPGTTAKAPNSFVYRYVAEAPGRPRRTASSRCCRC